MPAPSTRLGVFDLETTGIDPALDRIVTAFVGEIDAEGRVINGREWMIRPDGYVIADGAAAIHGITTETALANGRPFSDVIPEVMDALGALAADGVPVVAHNASYDFTMFTHEMHRAGVHDPVGFVDSIHIIDTFILDKQIDKWRKGKRTLTAVAPLYGVTLSEDEAHGAQADAVAAGRVALALLSAPLIRGMRFDALRRLQTGWAREQRASLIQYKRSHGEPDFTVPLDWPLYASALALRAPEEVFSF